MSAPRYPAELLTGKPLIFVVEDDTDIARLVCLHLGLSGYTTRWFPGALSVVEEAVKNVPSLFLLDIMIPGDGFELCRHIRQSKTLAGVHIIFLTAKASEADRVRGLELGGDDYITKPFSPRELVARVRAVLRRSQGAEQPSALKLGHIEIDAASMIVRVGGATVATTTREFRLLEYLARHAARVFTRDQLLDAVWTEGSFVTPRSIDVYVRRLREKIEPDPDHPSYLKTVRGIGYRFDVPKETGKEVR
ncbi:MAG: response regulator transcription factor [Acidobacteriia bacterium]|nr:response regulator transcription factor [Terriglobia bacterium]